MVTNYGEYTLTNAERIKYISTAAVILFFVGYMFFMNIFICIILCGFSFLYPVIKRKELVKKRKNKLCMQFKDALYSISSSLSAGRAIERAFKTALEDLNIIYQDNNAFIISEFELINRKIDMNESIESALLDFAERSDIEDIKNFADVFIICKSSGGNLIEVIKSTSNIINQKIEIKNEIDILVTEQKFSQKVLNIMPFGLLILIVTSSPDYIQPLYSVKGHFVMFIVLILLTVSYFIGSKIMDIKV